MYRTLQSYTVRYNRSFEGLFKIETQELKLFIPSNPSSKNAKPENMHF